jgi:hypothetical protein
MPINRKQFLQTTGITTAGSLLLPGILSGNKQLTTIKENNMNNITGETASMEDYAFFMGKWKILNKKLKTRFNNSNEWVEFEAREEVSKILNGRGYIGQYHTNFDGKPFEGVGIHLFDPATNKWSNYWADGSSGTMAPPVTGGFDGKIGRFYGKDVDSNKQVDVFFLWDATDADNPVWSQAFSADAGKTWETNWYMYYSRIK